MLRYSVPPGYQRQQAVQRPKLGPWVGVIDAILEEDKTRPAKQRHTAKRIFDRLKEERKRVVLAGCTSSGAGFRMFVCLKRSLNWMG
jgi:hypothetical protein